MEREIEFRIGFLKYFKDKFRDVEIETIIRNFKVPGLSKELDKLITDNEDLTSLIFLLSAFYNFLYRKAPYIRDMNIETMEILKVEYSPSFTIIKVKYKYR